MVEGEASPALSAERWGVNPANSTVISMAAWPVWSCKQQTSGVIDTCLTAWAYLHVRAQAKASPNHNDSPFAGRDSRRPAVRGRMDVRRAKTFYFSKVQTITTVRFLVENVETAGAGGGSRRCPDFLASVAARRPIATRH